MDDVRGYFREAYAQHRDRIHGFFVRRTGDRETALDLTQEVFVRALRYMASFDPERGELGAWLFGIAANVFKSHLARTGALAEASLPETELADEARRTPGDVIESQLTSQEIMAVVEALPEPERSVVIHHRLDGRTLDQTADDLGISRRTVSRKLGNALVLLRERLNRLELGL